MLIEKDYEEELLSGRQLISFSLLLGGIGYILIILSLVLPWYSFTIMGRWPTSSLTYKIFINLINAVNFTPIVFIINLSCSIYGTIASSLLLIILWKRKIFSFTLFTLNIIPISVMLFSINLFNLDFSGPGTGMEGYAYGFYIYTGGISMIFIMLLFNFIGVLKTKKNNALKNLNKISDWLREGEV